MSVYTQPWVNSMIAILSPLMKPSKNINRSRLNNQQTHTRKGYIKKTLSHPLQLWKKKMQRTYGPR